MMFGKRLLKKGLDIVTRGSLTLTTTRKFASGNTNPLALGNTNHLTTKRFIAHRTHSSPQQSAAATTLDSINTSNGSVLTISALKPMHVNDILPFSTLPNQQRSYSCSSTSMNYEVMRYINCTDYIGLDKLLSFNSKLVDNNVLGYLNNSLNNLCLSAKAKNFDVTTARLATCLIKHGATFYNTTEDISGLLNYILLKLEADTAKQVVSKLIKQGVSLHCTVTINIDGKQHTNSFIGAAMAVAERRRSGRELAEHYIKNITSLNYQYHLSECRTYLLMFAVRELNDPHWVSKLLEAGASSNIIDHQGRNPLHHVLSKDVAQVLIDHYGHRRASDYHGNTPADLLRGQKGNKVEEIIDLLERPVAISKMGH